MPELKPIGEVFLRFAYGADVSADVRRFISDTLDDNVKEIERSIHWARASDEELMRGVSEGEILARAEHEVFRPFWASLVGRVTGRPEKSTAQREPISDVLANLNVLNVRDNELADGQRGGSYLQAQVEEPSWDDVVQIVNDEQRAWAGVERTAFAGAASRAAENAPAERPPVSSSHLSLEDRIARCGILKGSPLMLSAVFIVENRIERTHAREADIVKRLMEALPEKTVTDSAVRSRVVKIYRALGKTLEIFDAIEA